MIDDLVKTWILEADNILNINNISNQFLQISVLQTKINFEIYNTEIEPLRKSVFSREENQKFVLELYRNKIYTHRIYQIYNIIDMYFILKCWSEDSDNKYYNVCLNLFIEYIDYVSVRYNKQKLNIRSSQKIISISDDDIELLNVELSKLNAMLDDEINMQHIEGVANYAINNLTKNRD